jgi:hypothetical protein
MGLGGAYASLNNKNFSDDMVSEIMNLQLGVFYLRPLNDKWSMMANIGVGVYAPFAEFSKIRYKKYEVGRCGSMAKHQTVGIVATGRAKRISVIKKVVVTQCQHGFLYGTTAAGEFGYCQETP